MSQPQQDAWNPGQYEKFRAEREAPGLDLIAGIRPGVFERGIDLGCGTGELTRRVQENLGVGEMVGIDTSESMLTKARLLETKGLKFEVGGIEEFSAVDEYDLVFSNAAIQWCGSHEAVLGAIVRALRANGQLAIQMPSNHDYPTHRIADELGNEEPYRTASGGAARPTNVRTPEWYAETLYRLGLKERRVELKVYGHVLASREDVVEWVKGTLLTWYESRMSTEMFSRFQEEFRRRLWEVLPDERPYFYPFKRVFLWGRK